MQRRDAVIDIIAVVGVCLTYVLLEVLHLPKRWTLLVMALALAVYATYFIRRRGDSWHALGFRADNLRAAVVPIGVTTLVAAAGLVAVALRQGRAAWGPEVLLLLGLYPTWALAQQLAFQGVLHRRLMLFLRPPALQVLITATAFSSVHYGSFVLMTLTFTAGLLWSLLYRRWPNLWLLAGSHTVLAALAYPLILADDPLSRF